MNEKDTDMISNTPDQAQQDIDGHFHKIICLVSVTMKKLNPIRLLNDNAY